MEDYSRAIWDDLGCDGNVRGRVWKTISNVTLRFFFLSQRFWEGLENYCKSDLESIWGVTELSRRKRNRWAGGQQHQKLKSPTFHLRIASHEASVHRCCRMTNSLSVSMLKPRMVMEQAGKAIQSKLYVEANGQVPEKCFVAGTRAQIRYR